MKEGNNLFTRLARLSLPPPTAQFLPIMLEATPPPPLHLAFTFSASVDDGLYLVAACRLPPSLVSNLYCLLSIEDSLCPLPPSLDPSLPSPPSLPLHITSRFTHRLAVAPGCNFGVTSARTHSPAVAVPSLRATLMRRTARPASLMQAFILARRSRSPTLLL